jgi:excisionase family DNA binding protein
MAEEKLLTIREVSIILGISEKQVMDLAESGTIPAYKIGGVFLRFKKEQVYEYKKALHGHTHRHHVKDEIPSQEKLSDFFYFNDFYILASLLIILLLVIIFRGY